MAPAILAGIKIALIRVVSTVMTEKLFAKVAARVVVSLVEWLVKSTKTSVDDEIAAPFIEALKKEY